MCYLLLNIQQLFPIAFVFFSCLKQGQRIYIYFFSLSLLCIARQEPSFVFFLKWTTSATAPKALLRISATSFCPRNYYPFLFYNVHPYVIPLLMYSGYYIMLCNMYIYILMRTPCHALNGPMRYDLRLLWDLRCGTIWRGIHQHIMLKQCDVCGGIAERFCGDCRKRQ